MRYSPAMSLIAARLLVFFTAAAVLVLEILAGRLLAPYLGITLETFTGIIGTVLAGISVGAWLGGRAADRMDPHRLLAPLLIAGGITAMLAPAIVTALGPALRAAGPAEIVLLAGFGFFAPAALLSAVSPVVVKIRLASLDQTGSVVGGFSAIGTAGAIFGTFATGFVLLAALPTRPIAVALGGALVATGIAFEVSRRRTAGLLVALAVAIAAAGLTTAAAGPCDRETAYYCAYVTVDDDRSTGRILWLDTYRHSYVDMEDPTYLGFRYARDMSGVLATLPKGPLDVLYIGGGGFTLPHYIDAVRPGSRATVLELDPSIIKIAERDLGVVLDDGIEAIVGDARISLGGRPSEAYDLVIGDAFGGLSVPWHLTTTEFVDELKARLRPGGIYMLNLIDYPPHGFARAEIETIHGVFAEVIVISQAPYFRGHAGGNFVIVASDGPLDLTAIAAAIAEAGGSDLAISGAELDEFVAGAPRLRDDFAPVDQLISRP